MELNKICAVFSGYAFKIFNNDKTGKPVIKIGNILSDGTVNLTSCQYSIEEPNNKYLSKKGDIYIALSGATTGKIGLMTENNFLINQRVGIVRLNDMSIPIKYLCYFLKSKTKKILNDAFGAAQPNISPKDIAKYNLPFFDTNKMESIANELSNIEMVIKSCNKKLHFLDELIKSRFIKQEARV